MATMNRLTTEDLKPGDLVTFYSQEEGWSDIEVERFTSTRMVLANGVRIWRDIEGASRYNRNTIYGPTPDRFSIEIWPFDHPEIQDRRRRDQAERIEREAVRFVGNSLRGLMDSREAVNDARSLDGIEAVLGAWYKTLGVLFQSTSIARRKITNLKGED